MKKVASTHYTERKEKKIERKKKTYNKYEKMKDYTYQTHDFFKGKIPMFLYAKALIFEKDQLIQGNQFLKNLLAHPR